jgi:hypothetical protein
MNITTLITRRSARASVALAMATAVLLGASACGSEHDRSPADTSEKLVDGAKKRYSDRGRSPAGNQAGNGQESPVLPPDGRPVPLPGQNE